MRNNGMTTLSMHRRPLLADHHRSPHGAVGLTHTMLRKGVNGLPRQSAAGALTGGTSVHAGTAGKGARGAGGVNPQKWTYRPTTVFQTPSSRPFTRREWFLRGLLQLIPYA